MRRLVALLAICAILSSCFVFRGVDVRPIDAQEGTRVTSPVKAHLKDGSTIVYPRGLTVAGGFLQGAGDRYDVTLTKTGIVDSVPLDLVIGMESFRTRVDVAKTVIVSTLATIGIMVGTVALAIVIFGSCPTVYSGEGVEEAELFSSSVAPLFEGRDLDRLHAKADAAGAVRLEIRNEAMETHYINHLQLLDVRHAIDETVLPDMQGRPVIVGGIATPATIVDRAGRDLRTTLAVADDKAYRTDQPAIEAAVASDMDQWIDLTLPVPIDADTTTLVFRMRNSLLSTVLLYDVMLGSTGANALDWLGEGLANISTAVELGRWYQRRAGLHISVWKDGSYQEVARVPDSGPITWHDVAAIIPVVRGEPTMRVRLSFLADHWRIDRVGVAASVRPVDPKVVPIAQVTNSRGEIEMEALARLSAPDDEYLQTNPGQRFVARFDAGPAPAGLSRTFLLSSQGYYIEWVRGEWIKTASVPEPFAPSDEGLLIALHKWSGIRETFEERFVRSRVPVR
jgi:hypothetical protein